MSMNFLRMNVFSCIKFPFNFLFFYPTLPSLVPVAGHVTNGFPTI